MLSQVPKAGPGAPGDEWGTDLSLGKVGWSVVLGVWATCHRVIGEVTAPGGAEEVLLQGLPRRCIWGARIRFDHRMKPLCGH